MKQTTREMIAKFSHAFGRPVNSEYQRDMSVSDRILLGSILLEEVVEYCTKGLGLTVVVHNHEHEDFQVARQHRHSLQNDIKLTHCEGDLMNHFEVVDGLADVNVVAHFNAHWHGFNLDEATEVAHDSNMSKLDADGKPIINVLIATGDPEGDYNESLIDPTKPAGKILKSANFREPDFSRFVFKTTNSGV